MRRIQIVLKSINPIINFIEKSKRKDVIESVNGINLSTEKNSLNPNLMYLSVCFPRHTFEIFSTLFFIVVHPILLLWPL